MSEPRQQPRGMLALAIARPVTVASSVLLVLFFGALSVLDLPVQLTPDISPPTVTVDTFWPGAAPVEVEAEILEEQEEVLKRVQGLVRMESTASQNGGSIELEFDVGTDLEGALVRVTNQLGQVQNQPTSARKPIVSTANSSGPPLAVILVRHREGRSVAAYRTWVEEEVVPRLERVEGVAGVRIRGGRVSEVQVDFDTAALAARRLTIPAVAARLRSELRNSSAGELDVGKRRLLVRTMVTSATVRGLEDVVLSVASDGTPVRLADVADVRVGLRRPSDFAIGDDRDAIALLPRREAGTNVLQVTEALIRVVEQLDREEFAPEGLTMEVVDDQTSYIYEALDRVKANLLVGAVLATLCLLLFLRSMAASAVVALAIPMCVMGTALCMSLLGRSVNVVSLAGVTFAVGMVVDNSIVALENIDTWRRRVSDVAEAALSGIREVWGAILASTATTATVFVPILLWKGEVGELLRDIAWAIAIAVTLSLFVSVLVIPSFAARILSPGDSSGTPGRLVRWGAAIRDACTDVARWSSARAARSVAVVTGVVAVACATTYVFLPSMEYLPTGNRNLVFGIVLPPPGYSIDELQKIGFENQDVMARHTGRDADGVPAIRRSFFVGDPARLFIGAAAEDPARVREMREFMRSLHAKIPGTIGSAAQAALFSRGIGEGRTVEIELAGKSLEDLVAVGRRLFGEIKEVVPGAQVRPVPLLDLGAPELHVLPARVDAAAMGFSPADVALVADAYVDGAILGEYGEEGARKADIVLRGRLDGAGVHDDVSLEGAPVATPHGEIVPFGVLASVSTRLGPTVIQRIERKRSVVLQVTPPDEMPFEVAVERVERHVRELSEKGGVPAGVDATLGGSAGKLVLAQQQFVWILLLAFVILYLLLAGLFEDFVAPVVVLVTLPLAAVGGVLGLGASNALLAPQALDLVSALGFLILFGIVVNNAILIVHGALARLRDGEELVSATSEAVRSRVRPIFMSTLTSMAGLLPMVVASGSGSELYRGVGAIVLGGLASSTALTLVVVPSLFVLQWRLRRTSAARA